MVKKTAGSRPVDPVVNVVSHVLRNPSYRGVEINDETHGLLGYLFWANYYTMCAKTNLDPGALDNIPQEAFDVFAPLVGESALYRACTLQGTQSFVARTQYLPHVETLGKRLGIRDLDTLYTEYFVDFDPEDVALQMHSAYSVQLDKKRMPRGYYDTMKAVKKEEAIKAMTLKMAKKGAKQGKDAVFCTGRGAASRNGLHELVHGNSRVCKDCGLVLGTNYEHEETFGEDGLVVQHTTEKEERKPRLRRYEYPRGGSSPKARVTKGGEMYMPKSALDRHREAFVASLDKFNTSPYLVSYLQNLWDMCIDGGFSPSNRLSAKIIVGGYMVWRLCHPKEEHYLDFNFQMTRVHYWVLDDAVGNMEAQMPNFFVPSKKLSPRYQPDAVHYASNLAKHIAVTTKAAMAALEMDPSRKEQLRQTQCARRTEGRTQRVTAFNLGTLEYVGVKNLARTAKAKRCPPHVQARAEEKNATCLANAHEANRSRLSRISPVSTQVVPEFQLSTRFYGDHVKYFVQVQDESHISMFPGLTEHSTRVDVAVELSIAFQAEKTKIPNITLTYGSQRCKLINTGVVEGKNTRKCTFFVQSYSAMRPKFQVKCAHSFREVELSMKPQGVMHEFGPKTRARVCMFFVPIPLLLRSLWQNVNIYLGNPAYSPVKSMGQVCEEEEEDQPVKKRTRNSQLAKDVDSSDEEPF